MIEAGKGVAVSRLNRLNISTRMAGMGVVVVACLLAGCGERKAQPRAQVLARVGDREITEVDFKWELDRRHNAGLPDADKLVVLNDLIQHEALVQRARAAGLDADPQVKREVSNLLIGKLMDRQLRQKEEQVTVSPEDVKAWYDSHKDSYTRPAQVRLAVLKLEFDPKATGARKTEVRQRMEDARSQFMADPPRGRGPSNTGFGRLAQDFSDDQASRYRGGDIGWIEADRLPPRWPREVLEAGMALPLGQCSGVVESTGGVYLVMKTDSRDAVLAPLAEMEGSIRQHLKARKLQELQSVFRADSIRQSPVSIDTNALAALVMPSMRSAAIPQQGLPLLPRNPEKEVQP